MVRFFVPGLLAGKGTASDKKKNALSLPFGFNEKGICVGQGHSFTT